MSFDFMDPVLLARIQFAFTVSFHITFPAFTIGLASWLVVVEAMWLKTGKEVYKEIYKLWVKVFALTFGMGVVSGLVLSYEFGTNWSVFSDKIGNVIGPLLAYEVLTAFFLEASFLGIMLFGWGRVSNKVHFISTITVAFGTLVSAFWILSANSWMQTPSGFEVGSDGKLYPLNWIDVIFNPSFPYRLLHMVIGAYLTTAFVVAGVACYYLYRNIYQQHAKIMLIMAMIIAVFVAPLQLVIGDLHGLNTLKHQPIKIAAMEGIWENEKGAGLRLFAIPDSKNEKNTYEIAIPYVASYILTHSADGEIKGLKNWPKNERPPVGIVFYAFRLMVFIGICMILTGIFALYLNYKKRLFNTRWFQYWCMLLTPSGFIAVLAGWFVTEVGRQPYIVYNVLRTIETASPISAENVLFSLILFVVVYMFIFTAGSFYILSLLYNGPKVGDWYEKQDEEIKNETDLQKILHFKR